MRLVDARVALAAVRKMLAPGDDPGKKAVEQRRAERESETVSELVDLYINLHARPKKRSWRAVTGRVYDKYEDLNEKHGAVTLIGLRR